MHRRTFVGSVAAGLLACPLAAATLQPPVVGVLYPGHVAGPIVDGARQGLRDLGFVDGVGVTFELRSADGKPQTLPELAADLAHRKVDVILAIGPDALRAASGATRAIPIVAVDLESDPVQAGFARTLARPGGNVTGFFLDQPGLAGKWLELMLEAVPGVRRIAVLVDTSSGPWQLAATRRAAEKIGIVLQVLAVRTAEDLDRALAASVKGGSLALVTLPSPLFDYGASVRRIAQFTLEHRLPAISPFRRFAEAGGLMSYGPNQVEYLQRLPDFIARILKGARPADLPIEQPTTYDLVINAGTARALGLALPPSLLLRAEVIA